MDILNKKVLIVQEEIPHYNKPVFELLSRHCDLTVLYSKDNGLKYEFNTVFMRKDKKSSELKIMKLARNYDVVIRTLQLSDISTYLMLLSARKYKMILWGIGVAAAYNQRFDSSDKRVNIYRHMINRADAAIFYSDYPVKRYTSLGIPEDKLFVAHNTVEIKKIELNKNRNKLLFIGTLYKEKRVDLLIEEYRKAYEINKEISELLIIGDGPEKNDIESLIDRYHLNRKIEMLGKITDEERLSEIFKDVLLCISPDQAGLSVQKAMGYGTVFITKKDAITGGEIFDINSGINGILIDDFNEISKIITDCVENREKYLEMGNNAYDFYWNNRTVDKKVNGFIHAIDYVCNK